MNKVINFRNKVQQALYSAELSGQISDGMWENARPWDHWKPWGDAVAMVNPGNVGVNFYAQKNNYNFTSQDMLNVIGKRMCNICNLVENGYDETIAREFDEYDPEYGHGDAYWDRKREHFFALFGTVDNYREACKGSYNMKKLKAELTDMKSIIKTRSN